MFFNSSAHIVKQLQCLDCDVDMFFLGVATNQAGVSFGHLRAQVLSLSELRAPQP